MRHKLTFLCGLLALCFTLVTASSAQAAAPLFISLTFDDGDPTHYAERDLFTDAGVAATFYINSNGIGTGGYMTWSQVRALAADGHEIGGHTLDHANLTTLTRTQQETQVCDDRTALQGQGFTVTTFAYPNGAFNSGIKDVVRNCGYTSARTTGGLDDPPDCCLFANSIPPRVPDPFETRSWQVRLDTPLSDYRSVIELGRDYGGGWLPIVFHDICTGDCRGFSNYSVRRELLEDLIEWIQADPDLRIRTSAHMGLAAADTTAPTATLTSPADRDTVASGSVRLDATASDGLGVDRVEFRVDGTVVGTDTTSPYSVTWDSSRAGPTASITARAYDEKGNSTTSTAHVVSVGSPAERTPPTVSLTAPANSANVGPGAVSLTATASDASGIDRVEFLVDGNVVGSDSSSPYEYSWDPSRAGSTASITARAYDTVGNTATSSAAVVNVTTVERTPPSVTLGYIPSTSPGTILLSASASDASGVARVDWLVDGSVVASDLTYPYEATWDSTSYIGRYADITARAYDVPGNNATTSVRRVSVVAPSSSLRPVVSMVTPAGGTSVRGTVDLQVDVSSSPTTVSFVEILVDGVSIGIDWEAPFHEYHYFSSGTGPNYSVVARAVDVFGVPALSAPLALTYAR